MTAAPAPCVICGAAGATLEPMPHLGTSPDLAHLGEFSVGRCPTCGVARTVPLPSYDALVISPDVGGPALGRAQRALLDRFIRQRVARVSPLVGRANGRLLDIGAGACLFANAMAAAGHDLVAFEPNAANASQAGPGVRFVGSLFDEAGVRQAGLADASFDLVTMWHSLEHVTDPMATLRLVRRLLRPGGSVHVCVPNIDALQSRISGARWCYLDIPHHVTHFTPAGLFGALERTGFARGSQTLWNEEYEVFGFYQSLLNLVTGSHNYFYNRAKKGRACDAGPFPAWTRLATALGPLLLPLSVVGSVMAAIAGLPACAEVSARVPE